jgi:hypothetical protein
MRAKDRDLKNIAEFLQEKLLITGSFQQKIYKFVHFCVSKCDEHKF